MSTGVMTAGRTPTTLVRAQRWTTDKRMLGGHEASAALKLRPDWPYLRDNLLPQIEQRLRAER
jgi:hypothetical protein